jgi:starvation-inducible DNA-binding protein
MDTAVKIKARKDKQDQVAIDLGLKPNGLEKVGGVLGGVLADTYLLYLKTQNFHWNATGKNFGELHLMFEKQYQDLAEAVDELAERLRAIGQFAPVSFAQFRKLSKIEEETTVPEGMAMVRMLADDNEHVVRRMRKVLEISEDVGDSETGDILIRRMQYHAKQAWMLRSYLA